jgi:hypothetical protein
MCAYVRVCVFMCAYLWVYAFMCVYMLLLLDRILFDSMFID